MYPSLIIFGSGRIMRYANIEVFYRCLNRLNQLVWSGECLVSAGRAAVIAVMCTVADEQEEEENEEARVYNGATLRTLLGIRQIHSRHMASLPVRRTRDVRSRVG